MSNCVNFLINPKHFSFADNVSYVTNMDHQPAVTVMEIPIPRIMMTTMINIREMDRVIIRPVVRLSKLSHVLGRNHGHQSDVAAQVDAARVDAVQAVAAEVMAVEVSDEHHDQGTVQIGPEIVAKIGNVIVGHRATVTAVVVTPEIIDRPEANDSQENWWIIKEKQISCERESKSRI